MLLAVKLFTNRVHHTHYNHQHQHSLNAFPGKEKINMKNQTAFIVDNDNILWTLEYDSDDNSVTVLSDRTEPGGAAIISQYTLDNALGHDVPEQILSSAQALIKQDAVRKSTVQYVIDGLVADKRSSV